MCKIINLSRRYVIRNVISIFIIIIIIFNIIKIININIFIITIIIVTFTDTYFDEFSND